MVGWMVGCIGKVEGMIRVAFDGIESLLGEIAARVGVGVLDYMHGG